MAQIFMIRRKTDGHYVCGTGNYPWFSKSIGRTFYNMRSVKIFMTTHMRRKGIKTWKGGRYKFNAGEFFTPGNALMNCEIVSIEVTPTPVKDIFELSAEDEMKRSTKRKKPKDG